MLTFAYFIFMFNIYIITIIIISSSSSLLDIRATAQSFWRQTQVIQNRGDKRV